MGATLKGHSRIAYRGWRSHSWLLMAWTVVVMPGLHAQATRTWVSGVGDDVNPCSRTAPCKTYAGAISKTAAGGEIDALDPGGFGAVTITKSITINGAGTLASILASATNGVVINAAAADKIILRNIQINGAGATLGVNGIRFLAGAQLTVENCTIENFSGIGVDVALAAAAKVFVKDTFIKQCGQSGIRITSSAGAVTASLLRTEIAGNKFGVEVGSGNLAVQLDEVSLLSNAFYGLLVSGPSAQANVERSVFASNGVAANAGVAGAIIRLSDNAIYDNRLDLQIGLLNTRFPIILH